MGWLREHVEDGSWSCSYISCTYSIAKVASWLIEFVAPASNIPSDARCDTNRRITATKLIFMLASGQPW